MKTYEITRSTSGQIGVLVKFDDGREAAILKHVVLHSPTGMETGYGGSGPADLALSILADFLEGRRIEAIRLHQGFKWHFVAGRQIDWGQSYEIRGDEIAAFLRNVRAGETMAPQSESIKRV